MDLLLAFQKDDLQRIRNDISKLARNSKQDSSRTLNLIKRSDFCKAVVANVFESTNNDLRTVKYFTSPEFIYLIHSMLSYFEAVDIDSRGYLNYLDFTNYCLRVGRIRFKPTLKRALSNYIQDQFSDTKLFPTYKLHYISHFNTLFAFDSDTPTIRLFNDKRKFQGKFNPILELKKYMKTHSTLAKSYNEKKKFEKDSFMARQLERDLDPTKGMILCMEYIVSTKQIMISTSKGFIIFIEASDKLGDPECDRKVMGYIRPEYAQCGCMYSKNLNIIITWPGEGSDHTFLVWDPFSYRLKFKMKKHNYKVMSVCELILDPKHPWNKHYIASCSIDKQVLLWPTAPLIALSHNKHYENGAFANQEEGQEKKTRASGKMIRVSDTVTYEFKGHTNAIHSLQYASSQELLLGAGFDYSIYAWDPYTKDICMRFTGHFKSLVTIQIVQIPSERMVSIDESGLLKVWNIDKNLGLFGEQVQGLSLITSQHVPKVVDCVACFGNGSSIAILAERLYFMHIVHDDVEELRPVSGGLGFSEINGTLWCISKNAISSVQLIDGRLIKRVPFLDPDRIASHDMLKKVSDIPIMGSSAISNMDAIPSTSRPTTASSALSEGRGRSQPKLADTESIDDESAPTKSSKASFIDGSDVITAAATDYLGKKIFLGTLDGRVFIFDSNTLGLLLQLTDENEDAAFLSQGFVSSLCYVQRDQILVASYSNGAIKVFVGCHRNCGTQSSSPSAEEDKKREGTIDQQLQRTILANYTVGGGGGKTPNRPLFLREIDLGILNDNSMVAMDVTNDFCLIAACTRDGYIQLVDYISMNLLAFFKVPLFNNQPVRCQALKFAPKVPLLFCSDSAGRIHVFSVRQMGFRWVYTFSPYVDISYSNNKNEHHGWSRTIVATNPLEKSGLEDDLDPSMGQLITSLHCVMWKGSSTDVEQPPSRQSSASGLVNTGKKQKPNVQLSQSIRKKEFVLGKNRSSSSVRFKADDKEGKNTSPEGPKVRRRSRFDSILQRERSVATMTAERRLSDEEEREREREKASNVFSWNLILGDEGGNVMVVDITRLVYKTDAISHFPRSTPNLAVYQRIKPKRYNPNLERAVMGADAVTIYPLPEEYKHQLSQPIGSNVDISHASIYQVAKLLKYVSGIVRWVAYPGEPIRAINYSFLSEDFISKKPLNKPPSVLFTASEYGLVKMWAYDGKYLGQVREDIAEQEDKAEEEEAALVADPNGLGNSVNESSSPTKNIRGYRDEEGEEEEIIGSIKDIDLNDRNVFLTSVVTNRIEDILASPDERKSNSPADKNASEIRFSLFEKKDKYVHKHYSKKPARRRLSVVSKKNSMSMPKLPQPVEDPYSIDNVRKEINASISVCENLKLVPKPDHGQGWSFPSMLIEIKNLNFFDKDKEITTRGIVGKVELKYTLLQYHYFNDLISQELPQLIVYFEETKLFGKEMKEEEKRLRMKRLSSTYATKFNSTENLIQSLNRYIAEQVHPDQAITRVTEKVANSKIDSTKLSNELYQENQDAANQEYIEKAKKKNMISLIEYIQQSEFFDNGLKKSNSSSLVFENFEREAQRARKTKQKGQVNQIQKQYEFKKKLNKMDQQKSFVDLLLEDKNGSASPNEGPESSPNVGGMTSQGGTPAGSNAKRPQSANIEPIKVHRVQTVKDLFASDPPTPKSQVSESPQLLSESFAPFGSHADLQSRPRTAPGNMSTASLNRMPLPSGQTNRVAELRHAKSVAKIDKILDSLDGISVQEDFVSKRLASTNNLSDLVDPESNSTNVSSYHLQESYPEKVSNLGIQQSKMLQSQRIKEISDRYNQSIQDAISETRQYEMYDPLRNRQLKFHKKFGFKLIKDTVKYLEIDDDFSDIVDVEKELFLKEKKKMLGSLNDLENKLYGPYRLRDIFYFYHWMQQFTPVSQIDIKRYDPSLISEFHNEDRGLYMGQNRYLVHSFVKDKVFASASYSHSFDLGQLNEPMIELNDENLGHSFCLSGENSPQSEGRLSFFKKSGSEENKEDGFRRSGSYSDSSKRSQVGSAKDERGPERQGSELLIQGPQDDKQESKPSMSIRDEYFLIFIEMIEIFVESYENYFISEADVIHAVFPMANLHERARIFLFLNSIRHIFELLRSATPPKKFVSLKVANPSDSEDEGDLDDANDQRANQASNKDNKTETQRKTSIKKPKSSFEKPPLASKGSRGSNINAESGNPSVNLLAMGNTQQANKSPIQETKEDITNGQVKAISNDPMETECIATPHATRGFRNWTIQKKGLNKVCAFFDRCHRGESGSIMISELVEIFQALVPKQELSKYRVLRSLGVLIHRLGYKPTVEVTGEILTKIFQFVFEIRIRSGVVA